MTALPRTAKTLIKAAELHGWTVWATAATGTPLDASGMPQRVTERVPTGELTDAGKPRVQVVATAEPVVVASLAIRLSRGEQRLVALYEGGSYRTGLQQRPFRTLGARALAAVINDTEGQA